MKPVAILSLLALFIGLVLVGVPVSYVLGMVSGRTARVLFFCGVAVLLLLVVIGITTGRISSYEYAIRKGHK